MMLTFFNGGFVLLGFYII